MKFLNKINIRTRVILLALIPAIAICSAAIDQIQRAHTERTQINKMVELIGFMKQVSNLLAHLQDEQDVTISYISDLSDAELDHFKSMLPTTRNQLDATMVAFKNYADDHQSTLLSIPQIKASYGDLLTQWRHMPVIRKQTDRRLEELPAGLDVRFSSTFFSQMARDALRIIREINTIAAETDATLAKYSYSDYVLLRVRERASFERSMTLRALSGPVIGHILYGRLRVARDIQKIELENFMESSPPKLNQMMADSVLETATMKQVDALRLAIIKGEGKRPNLMTTQQWFELSSRYIQGLDQVDELTGQLILDRLAELRQHAEATLAWATGTAIGVLALIALMSILIIRSIVKPLKQLTTLMNQASQKLDLNVHLQHQGNDELSEVAQAYNNLIANLNQALTGIRHQSSHMHRLAAQVSSVMTHSIHNAESQSVATDSVSVAIHQMTTTIEEVASRAQETSEAVQRAYQDSRASSDNAKTSREIMSLLVNDLGDTSVQVTRLNDQSERIGSILNVIQGIAEQTNMLALNAAIEAARAGEQGRGFAVVADEVRQLASRTQESTEQIRIQIEELQQGALHTKETMYALQSKGGDAVGVVKACEEATGNLLQELDQITSMAAQIATAAEQQTNVANDINQQVHLIKDDSSSMAKQAQESAVAINELNQNGELLNQYVTQFQLDEMAVAIFRGAPSPTQLAPEPSETWKQRLA